MPKINYQYAKQNIKCDCGHYAKEHYLTEGCCTKCGCTWYYPNYHWLQKQRKGNQEHLENMDGAGI